jgi:hypothetical protein
MNYIFVQLPRVYKDELEKGRVIHRVKIPGISEKSGYRSISSLNAFNCGIKRSASKEDRRLHRDGCCWSHDSLYIGKREEQWREDQERTAKNPHLAHLDERNMPIIEHESIWAFYKHIGFDHKKRRYVSLSN